MLDVFLLFGCGCAEPLLARLVLQVVVDANGMRYFALAENRLCFENYKDLEGGTGVL